MVKNVILTRRVLALLVDRFKDARFTAEDIVQRVHSLVGEDDELRAALLACLVRPDDPRSVGTWLGLVKDHQIGLRVLRLGKRLHGYRRWYVEGVTPASESASAQTSTSERHPS